MAWLQSPDMRACAREFIRTKHTETEKHRVETKWRQIWCCSTAMMLKYSVKWYTCSWCTKMNVSDLVCTFLAAQVKYIIYIIFALQTIISKTTGRADTQISTNLSCSLHQNLGSTRAHPRQTAWVCSAIPQPDDTLDVYSRPSSLSALHGTHFNSHSSKRHCTAAVWD